jgi:hypothetical protein
MTARQCSQSPARWPGAAEHQATEEAPLPHATDKLEQSGMTTPDVLKLLLKQARELKEYFSYYVAAKTDSAKLRLQDTLLWMVFAALGFVMLGGFLVTASWFVLSGIAGGLGVLCGDRLWIGNIVTGVWALAALGLGVYYVVAKHQKAARERTTALYDNRQAQQQADFGHNVSERAASAVTERK